MTVSKQYTKEISDAFDYVATWLPTTQLSLGDVGILKGYKFKYVSTLGNFGIDFEEVPGYAKGVMDYVSSKVVDYSLKVAGSTPVSGSALAKADAGVLISFSRINAVVFQNSGCKSSKIKDVHGLGVEVLKLNEEGKWQDDYVVVTEVMKAKASTILISKGNKALIELKAEGAMEPAGLRLANLDSKFRVVRESQIGLKIIASGGLTPLLKTSGIKKGFIRGKKFRDPRARAREISEPRFVSVNYDDFSKKS